MMREPVELLRPAGRWPVLAWLAVVVCLLLAAGIGWRAMRLQELAQAEQTVVAQLQRQSRRPPPPKPGKADLETQRRWEALAAERSFNWYPVFRALEQTSSDDIALLEFVPDKSGRRLQLRGQALHREALTSYLDALARQGQFYEVYLAHQKNVPRNNLAVIEFEIRMAINISIK